MLKCLEKVHNVSEQMGNFGTEIGIIKKKMSQMKSLQIKYISEMKNSYIQLINRLETSVKKINKT